MTKLNYLTTLCRRYQCTTVGRVGMQLLRMTGWAIWKPGWANGKKFRRICVRATAL